jgi:hypothetical protein
MSNRIIVPSDTPLGTHAHTEITLVTTRTFRRTLTMYTKAGKPGFV